MLRIHCIAGATVGTLVAGAASAQVPQVITGPSSSATPYVVPAPGSGVRQVVSILTVGNTIGGYQLLGIPDGMGAFANGDGTMTLLVTHEHTANANGVQHAHQPAGFAGGAFISKWIVDTGSLAVLSGTDAMTSTVTTSNGTGGSLYNFNRFCSGDLADTSAYFNPASGLGTTHRIFCTGEEGGVPGRVIATDVDTGVAYQLQKWDSVQGSWENALARPMHSDETVMIGTSDGGANRVFLYRGAKQAGGNPVEQAGLQNGSVWGIQVQVDGVNVAAESRDFALGTVAPVYSGTFTIAAEGAAAGTSFLRPEDGAWDPMNPADFYFVSTDRMNTSSQVGRSRLWRMRFSDVNNVTAGGTIEVLLDGTEGGQMFDNMCLSNTIQGGTNIVIQEDPGNTPHNAKTLLYRVADDSLSLLLQSDPARFGDGVGPATAPFNQDEENSGVFDARDTLGLGWFVGNLQAHYSLAAPLLEGGQIYAFYAPEVVGSCAADFNVDGVVDGGDLGTLLSSWSMSGLTDFNADGVTDGADLGFFLSSWGDCAR